MSLLLAFISGFATCGALVLVAVYVRIEWRAHSDELERAWQRERGDE